MNSKKYEKYLKKYLKSVPIDNQEVFNSFKREYGHLKKEGLEINGLASLGDQTVISVRYPKNFDRNKIPQMYRGLIIR